MNAMDYLIIANTFLIFILAIWIFRIEKRLKKLFRGQNAKNLEQIIASLDEELQKLNLSRREIEKYLETVETRLRKSVQNVNTVRFNPFENSGSNQSFAVAFLNEKNDGVVISSLYSRDKVSVYAKPIRNGHSNYPLSEEERKAINSQK